MSNCSWAWLCALRTNRLEEMANKLACSCIQMTYAQLSLTIMGIIAYVSVWLSIGVFICWVWFGEGKGDILVLMCYILHNSAYPFCKSVIVTEIIVLPSLVDTGDICCHYWQHILVSFVFIVLISSLHSGSMWLIYPYPSGLLHWHCGNHKIAPTTVKQPQRIWEKSFNA